MTRHRIDRTLQFKRTHPTLGAVKGSTWVQVQGQIVGSYARLESMRDGKRYHLETSLLSGYFATAWEVRSALRSAVETLTPRLFE